MEYLPIHGLHGFNLFVGKTFLPTPLLPTNPHLVISIPYPDGRMCGNPPQVVLHLSTDIFQVRDPFLLKHRIHSTGKHQIMPNQDPSLIHCLIKTIMLELPTSPHSNHIKLAKEGILLYFLIMTRIDLSHTHLHWDIVATPHKHIISIQINNKRFPSLVLLLDHFDRSKTSSDRFLVKSCSIAIFYLDFYIG